MPAKFRILPMAFLSLIFFATSAIAMNITAPISPITSFDSPYDLNKLPTFSFFDTLTVNWTHNPSIDPERIIIIANISKTPTQRLKAMPIPVRAANQASIITWHNPDPREGMLIYFAIAECVEPWWDAEVYDQTGWFLIVNDTHTGGSLNDEEQGSNNEGQAALVQRTLPSATAERPICDDPTYGTHWDCSTWSAPAISPLTMATTSASSFPTKDLPSGIGSETIWSVTSGVSGVSVVAVSPTPNPPSTATDDAGATTSPDRTKALTLISVSSTSDASSTSGPPVALEPTSVQSSTSTTATTTSASMSTTSATSAAPPRFGGPPDFPHRTILLQLWVLVVAGIYADDDQRMLILLIILQTCLVVHAAVDLWSAASEYMTMTETTTRLLVEEALINFWKA